jgi:hypothetical protein
MTPPLRIESKLFPPATPEPLGQDLIELFEKLRAAGKNIVGQIAKVVASPTSLRRDAQKWASVGIPQRSHRPFVLRSAKDCAVIIGRN